MREIPFLPPAPRVEVRQGQVVRWVFAAASLALVALSALALALVGDPSVLDRTWQLTAAARGASGDCLCFAARWLSVLGRASLSVGAALTRPLDYAAVRLELVARIAVVAVLGGASLAATVILVRDLLSPSLSFRRRKEHRP